MYRPLQERLGLRRCRIPVTGAAPLSAEIIAFFHGIGVPTIVIGVPARYIHTHNSIIDINDYLAGIKLVTELVRKLDKKTAASFVKF